MNVRWGWITPLAMLLVVLTVGCKSTRPDLKPAKEPEVLNPPPASIVGNNVYPKQAYNTDDPAKRLGLDPGQVMPARGPGTPIGPANFGGPMQMR